jgi:uncharacterized MAPEG superfamily protein
MPSANYSLFAIPAYMVLAMVPHSYSVWLVTKHNNRKFDLPSPRSTDNRVRIEKSVPRHIYRKYERCRAAHDNMLENMAFVTAGILAGIVGTLDASFMNTACAVYLVSRVLHIISYVQISSHKFATLRTLWYL